MKPTPFRLSSLVVSIVLGVAISVVLRDYRVSDQLIPPIDNAPPVENINYRFDCIVISIPVDGEFYIGKHRFGLAEISEVVAHSLTSIPNDGRVAYLKPAAGVKAETLALVIKEVKLAGVDRIELVLDKKKVGSSKQMAVPLN